MSPSGPTARSFGAWNPTSAKYDTDPSGATRCIPGVAYRGSGGVDEPQIGNAEKSSPPFWVTRKPPSAHNAAALAPPPTPATSSLVPDETNTRHSPPPHTLFTTHV